MKLVRALCLHHNTRPTREVSLVVLHADGSPSEKATLTWLADPKSKVSYHTLVGRKGELWSLVPIERRAWHAGVSEYNGRTDVNDFSVGLCFANDQKGERYTEAQYAAGALYLDWLLSQQPGLSLDRITTHAAVARPLGRKRDPGPLFDVGLLTQGVATIRAKAKAPAVERIA